MRVYVTREKYAKSLEDWLCSELVTMGVYLRASGTRRGSLD